MYLTELPADPTVPSWVTVMLVLGPILIGGGGITAFLKARWDRRAGVQAHEVEEDDAIVQRWEALTKAQVEMLLNPLSSRLATLEEKVRELEAALEVSRKKYWTAIVYVRALLTLLHRHASTVSPPPPPAYIADDI